METVDSVGGSRNLPRLLPVFVVAGAALLLAKGFLQFFFTPNTGYDARLLWSASQY